MKFQNKTVLITGGAQGMGKAFALKFISEGATTIIFDLRKPDFECKFFEVDVRDENSIILALEKIKTIDVLVNNAGIFYQKDILETSADEISKMIDINLKGNILITKHVLPLLKLSKGNIVNISSCLGLITEPGSAIYSATKAGIVMLTKSFALEYIREGIRVNAVLPGPIDTPLLREYLKTDELIEKHGNRKPIGRIGKPEEVANVVAFLASDEASYVTGSTYSVDGGEAATSLYTKRY